MCRELNASVKLWLIIFLVRHEKPKSDQEVPKQKTHQNYLSNRQINALIVEIKGPESWWIEVIP